MQTYKLIEHRINEGGSVTEGKGYGLIKDPLRITPISEPIPEAYRDISTISYWYNFGFDLDRDFILL